MDIGLVSGDRFPLAEYPHTLVFAGYERRSSGLLRAEIRHGQFHPIRANANRNQSFRLNEQAFIESGASFVDAVSGMELRAELIDLLGVISDRPHKANAPILAIDISSMPRSTILTVVEALRDFARISGRIVADFLYSPGIFREHPPSENTRLELAALSQSLIGAPRTSRVRTRVAVGLGYEPLRTRGALEYLEPDEYWFFVPVSPDDRYDDRVEAANRDALRGLPARNKLLYQVNDPPSTYLAIQSFWQAKRSERTLLLPMGPKVFALACIALGLSGEPDAPAVWRLGAAADTDPAIEVLDSGSYFCLRLGFDSADQSLGRDARAAD